MNRESPKRPHEGLAAWQKAMPLVEHVYACSARYPDEERYGLTAQLRRAAVSIPSNIAEGAARRSTPEFLRFLSIARGSLAELDTQLQIAIRLGYHPPPEALHACIDDVFALLTGLIHSLSARKATR